MKYKMGEGMEWFQKKIAKCPHLRVNGEIELKSVYVNNFTKSASIAMPVFKNVRFDVLDRAPEGVVEAEQRKSSNDLLRLLNRGK
jgi:hypothetical protein